ncbi:MAG: hypothetical protein AB8F34_06670 [Akkermansiaceae bacterium]
MKLLPILTMGCLCGTAFAQDGSENYLNFIIQTQSDANRTTHKLDDVNPEGNAKALEGVIGSSVFQLWTIHRTKGSEHLLDEKIVSSYHPEASITILTDDPYTGGVPRTRVDHPFTVTKTVSGLVTNDPKVQDAAKSVIFEHKTTNYLPQPSGIELPETRLLGAVKTLQGVIDKNGTTKETLLTTLPGTDLTKVSGIEEFTIYAQPDYGIEESHMLAKASVQVWPIARATISGLDTKEWHIKLPNIKIELEDLYPSSSTYLRVYKGRPKPNPKTPFIINTSFVKIDDTVPQNRSFAISGKELGITQKGRYTIEILHETPFGIDILNQTFPLKVKSGIKVIGSLNTSE